MLILETAYSLALGKKKEKKTEKNSLKERRQLQNNDVHE